MKAIKRTVAALLATLMLATSTSFTLAAETYTDDEAVVVSKVSGAGIMTGTDKGFEPSKSLTRAEAAAIIVRMKGIKESAVKSMAGTTLFNDVAASHWASGYVNEASQLGIVKGVSATEFAPEREVTVAEFVTMAIRALGAGTMVDAEGTWPTNYVNFANENDLLEDVTAVYTATASRMNAATIVANTLVAPMWAKTKATTNKEVTWEETDKTILSNVLNIAVVENVNIGDIKINDRTIDWASVETEQVLKDPEDPSLGYKTVAKYFDNDADVAKEVSLATLKTAIEYDLWINTKEKEIVAIFKTEDNKKNVVEFTEIKKIGNSFIKVVVDGKEVEYDLTTDSDYCLNDGVLVSDTKITEALLPTAKLDGAFGSIVLDGDEVLAIYVNQYTNFGLVDKISSKKIEIKKAAKQNLTEAEDIKYTNEDYTFFVLKDGKEISVNDIKEDDALFVYEDADNDKVLHILVSTKTEEGEVTATSSSYIKVDGEKYSYVSGLALPTVEEEYTFYFNEAGKICAYEGVKSTGKYAIVKQLEFIQGRKGIDVEIKLAYADGTESDAMVVDFEDTKSFEDNYYELSSVTSPSARDSETSVDVLNGDVKAGKVALLGEVVEYTMKSGKVIINKVGANNLTDASKEFTGADLKIGTKSYIAADKKYYVDNNTKFVTIKKYTEDKDKYKVKVEALSLDDLDSITSSTLKGIVVDYDSDNNNKPDFVILTDGYKRAAVEEDWAIVLASTTDVKGDYKSEVTLLTKSGEDNYNYDGDVADVADGNIGIMHIVGNELTELEADSDYTKESLAADSYIKENNDGILEVVVVSYDSTNKCAKFTADAVLDTEVLSDDVLYIKSKSTGLVVGKESEIEEVKGFNEDELVDSDAYDDAIADYTQILGVYYYNNDGVKEIIAIIYK